MSVVYDQSFESALNKFNVVGEKELFNDEMVEVIATTIGVKAELEYVDFHSSRPGHDLRYALDGDKLRSLGWTPPVPLLESLERTVKWYLHNPEWLQG